MAEQLERRADKLSKFTPGAFTSKIRLNNEKGLLPTPKDKEPVNEALTDYKSAKIGAYDPSINHVKCKDAMR